MPPVPPAGGIREILAATVVVASFIRLQVLLIAAFSAPLR
jgi:hypothetical protein